MQSIKRSRSTKKTTPRGIVKVKTIGSITEYAIPSNGLKILYAERKGTGVITSNILYHVGSRDEAHGETGIAHMLEHMLFKPTKHDLKRKTTALAHIFESGVGAVLNATTWKDRTTYFFSYPKEHFDTALQIESERMRDVVLTDAEFKPERTNVLSEYDMNAGDEDFLLAVPMVGAAFQSHPYGHETIGSREDIEGYTVDDLKAFYEKFYAPNNAVLMIVGDVREKEMRACVAKHFATILPSRTYTPRKIIKEPRQEGLRTVEVVRPSTKNILAIGMRHEGFPSTPWFETSVVFELLAGDKDSVLHKRLVDTGKASRVHGSIEPTYDPNLGILFVTLAPGITHDEMYAEVRAILNNLTVKDIAPYLKKIIAKSLTAEFTNRENSYGFMMELIEYESAGAWECFFETEKTLKSLTPRAIHARIHALLDEKTLTIGKFIGKQ